MRAIRSTEEFFPVISMPSDIMASIRVQPLPAEFIVLNRVDTADEAINLSKGAVSCFTDGSRLDNKSGSGYAVYRNNFNGSVAGFH